MYKQVTVLRNYYATSDPDEFCFDKYKDNKAFLLEKHRKAMRFYDDWAKEYFNSLEEAPEEEENCSRVYPRDLLPQEHHNQQGHWRIIVEFIPTGKED